MIDDPAGVGQEIRSFEERVDILERELELAVKWQRPCLLLVVYESECMRTDVATALGNYLEDLGQDAVSLTLQDRNSSELTPFFREFRKTAETVFFVDGLCHPNGPALSDGTSLNLQREFFTERQVRVILWLTQNELVELAHDAPDFWSYRQRLIEFADSPRPSQPVGNHSDPLEDRNRPLSSAQAQIGPPPDHEPESSIQAKGLLTVGILNWRKGEYEAADEQLREALKYAAKIQDNRLEAECFNAVALVKTSMKRIDEAIAAYKQAILLAPEQIYAWNNLGILCAKVGRNDEALVTFQKAIQCNPKDPIGWNGLGNVYFRIGYVEEAAAAYQKSIDFMPTFARPWTGLGDVFVSRGQAEAAIKSYRKAIELNHLYTIPWLRLGSLFSRRDQFREAIKSYLMALAIEPGNSQTWNDVGSLYLKCLALEEAAEAFTKALDVDPKYGSALSNLAFTRTQQGRYEEALPLYLKSIEFSEEGKAKASACNRLGDHYRLINQYENAIAVYQLADIFDPDTASLRSTHTANGSGSENPAPQTEAPQGAVGSNQLEGSPIAPVQTATAKGLSQQEAHPSVLREESLQDAPYWIFNPAPTNDAAPSTPLMGGAFHPENHIDQVIALNDEAQGREGEAMSQLNSPESKKKVSAQASGPGSITESTNAYVWNERGNVLFNQGALEEAIAAYNKAIQLEPSFGWPYSNLALAYLTQNQFTEAILLYKKSIDLLDSVYDKAVSWNGLGNVYRCINDYPNAIAAYQKAGELDPETSGMREGADSFQSGHTPRTAQVWGDLGELFFKTGAYDEAIDAFNKSIELEPDSGVHYNGLAYALVSRGQYTDAIPLYQKSLELLKDDKEKAGVWNRLGNAYRKLNDYEKAIHAYQQAVLLADEGVSLLTRTRFSLLSNVDATR